MLTYMNTLKDNTRLAEVLGLESHCDPAFPLPNMKRTDESEFWGYRSSQGFRSETWISPRLIEDKNGKKRWANSLIYFLDHASYIAGGFLVVIFYSEHRDGKYIHDIEYHSWRACEHDFKEKNTGNCQHRYTCSKCKAHYDIDSSG